MELKAEELELKPPAHVAREAESRTGIDLALDALVPRAGALAKSSVHVALEEYLARISSLGRKCQGLQYREESWKSLLEDVRRRFERLCGGDRVPSTAGLPDGAVMQIRVSMADQRVESEFEAVLFGIRSTLDVLARLLAAHCRGMTDLHSFHRLVERVPPDLASTPVGKIVQQSWEQWASDLTDRRNAAGHYVALSMRSEQLTTARPGITATRERVFLGIPAKPTRASVSVWETGLPFSSGNVSKVVSLEDRTVEAHGIFDGSGRLVVRRNGPLPDAPEMIDADEYVTACFQNARRLVEDALRGLRG